VVVGWVAGDVGDADWMLWMRGARGYAASCGFLLEMGFCTVILKGLSVGFSEMVKKWV